MIKNINDYFLATATRKRDNTASSFSSSCIDIADSILPKTKKALEPSPEQQKVSTSSNIIRNLDKSAPIKPSLESFPKTRFKNEKLDRHFKPAWYEGRPWLEYIKDIEA